MWIRSVAPHERVVVFRMGKSDPSRVHGPGRLFLIPIIDMAVTVDMREQAAVVHCPARTEDEVDVTAELRLRWQIVDPFKSVVNVTDFRGAVSGVATTMLREVLAAIPLLDARARPDRVAEQVRAKLAERLERWGGRLLDLQLGDIAPSGATAA